MSPIRDELVDDARKFVIVPRRPAYSRAGIVFQILTLPWVLAIIGGSYLVAQSLGVPVPRVPVSIRLVVVIVAMTPIAIGLIAQLGPVPGVRWMFQLPTPRIVLTSDDVSLIPGRPGDPAWSVRWDDVMELRRRGLGGPLEIATRQGVMPLPSSLSLGKIEGTRNIVRLWELIEAWPGFQRPPRPPIAADEQDSRPQRTL